jgi:hypothetical protein
MKTISSIRSVIMVLIFFLAYEFAFPQFYSQRYVTRGADTAEIYINCEWYSDGYNTIWGTFHSMNNGASLSVQRKTIFGNGPIFGDSIPGSLFLIPYYAQDSFGISYDYGKTFEKRYCPMAYGETAGCMAGELYVGEFGLYRGTNYGNTFTLQSNTDSLQIEEVGTLPGEIYMTIHKSTNPFTLIYSNDYGQTFTFRQIPIPGMGHYFAEGDIHRGTQPGEIYLVVWQSHDTVALFHSFDYGQTLTFQSYMLITYDDLYYTPGRTPGTFYYVRRQNCGTPPRLNSCLWIYFSRDYGVTFTTYYYDLDSVFTGVPQKEILSQLKVFPDPASDRVTFRFENKQPDYDSKITLYDIIGKPVLEGILPKGQLEVTLNTQNLPAGIYCYSVISDKLATLTYKSSAVSQANSHGKILITR